MCLISLFMFAIIYKILCIAEEYILPTPRIGYYMFPHYVLLLVTKY